MGIFKRYWCQLQHYASSTRLLLALSATVIAALLFAMFTYHRSSGNPQQLKCCLENKTTLFFSFPGTPSLSSLLLPLSQFTTVDNIPYTEVESDGARWKVAALKTDSVGTLLADFSSGLIKDKLLPLISIVLDRNGAEYLLLVGRDGQVALSSMKFLIDHFHVDLKGVPGVEVKTPSDWATNGKPATFYLKLDFATF